MAYRTVVLIGRFLWAVPFFAWGLAAQTPASPSPTPPVPAVAPADSDITIHIPNHIASYKFLARKDYEDPQDGIMLRYRAEDSTVVDVFVYPGPDFAHQCSLECATKVFNDEVKGFQDAIPQMVQAKYVDSMTVAANESLTPPAGAGWYLGRHLALAVVREGKPMQSDYYLWYLRGYRVKVRATYPKRPPAFAALVADLPGALLRAPERDTMSHIQVSVKLPDPVPDLYRYMTAALIRLGYTIKDSSATEGRLLGVPHADGAPERLTSGPMIAIRMQRQGDSTTVGITAIASPGTVGPVGNGPMSAELVAVVRVAGELEKKKKAQ